ncbi:MAG: single-stranded-DNA-specific exonuclease RecJ [Kiritimatiellae bacterium]|nr:single-stranded-DNA-specific exonuclease RecJ [Kiritimatiellia bacterium]
MSRQPHPALINHWVTVPTDPEAVRSLASALNWPPAAASILVSRGITGVEEARAWIDPQRRHLLDPMRLPDMARAADRLWDAVANRERITVFGDYDVDGISSTALLCRLLRTLDADVRPFLPHRLDEGYGLSVEAFERCREETRPDLVVTVDCGTGSVAAVEAAQAIGIDVIITDHHESSGPVAPALAVVNPKLGNHEEDKLLAGVGVAFKLGHALLKTAHQRQSEPVAGEGGADPTRQLVAARKLLNQLLGLVALGTVADIVPLTGENRLVVRHGLDELNLNPWPWVSAMRQVAGIKDSIDTYEVGYLIGPRLNAAGRLGDAERSLALLLTDDSDEAARIARVLDEENRKRQDTEKDMVKTILDRRDPVFDPVTTHAVVEYGEGWHPGVAGIVASRLVARYHRPAIVMAVDPTTGIAKGSCRSIPGLNMVALLNTCSAHLTKHGGHQAAAGLELPAANLEAFSSAFSAAVAEVWSDDLSHPSQRIDAWLSLADCNEDLLHALDAMRPFGMGCPTPVFAVHGVEFAGSPREVGQGHLKCTFRQGSAMADGIGFGMFDREPPAPPFDIAFTLKWNHWGGRSKPDLHLADFRPGEA